LPKVAKEILASILKVRAKVVPSGFGFPVRPLLLNKKYYSS
jgi:hypothetical protein